MFWQIMFQPAVGPTGPEDVHHEEVETSPHGFLSVCESCQWENKEMCQWEKERPEQVSMASLETGLHVAGLEVFEAEKLQEDIKKCLELF